MTSYQLAKQYATALAESLTRIELNEFFENIHKQFYSELNVSFMNYFLEIAEHEGEFIIPHSKLLEYKIMTSTNSNHVAEKLNTLGLVENEDYLLTDVRQQLSSGAKYSKVYTLTPDAFKTCLMRAQKRSETINPIIYVNYYLLLEKIFKLFRDYQNVYNERLHYIKDDKLDKQSKKIDMLIEQNKELLGYAKETKEEATCAKEETIKISKKLDTMTDAMDSMHVDFTETAYHSTAIVKDSNQTYFALTGKINDNGSISFRAWRTQKERIFKVLTQAMTTNNHQLVIPPMYCAGVVNVPIAAMSKIKLQLKDIATKHNKKNKPARGERLSMTGLIDMSGLKLHCVKSLWVPNDYITRDDMVNAYLNIISDNQSISFELVDMPDDFKQIVDQRKAAYNKRIDVATGDAKEYLIAAAQTIHNAYVHTH